MTQKRLKMNRRLWIMVRDLPGGEQTMRDLVARLHQEEGTGKELLGTEDYTSTRKLTDGQFARLLKLVDEASKKRQHKVSPFGNLQYIITKAERDYIAYMASELGWTDDALARFIVRQTRGHGLKTHRNASSVIEPLERILGSKGYTLVEGKVRKWWTKSGEEKAS